MAAVRPIRPMRFLPFGYLSGMTEEETKTTTDAVPVFPDLIGSTTSPDGSGGQI